MKNYGACAFGVSLILTILSYEASALRCWYCSSDSRGGEFCEEPFKPNKLTSNERLYAYVECEPAMSNVLRPVCKKLVEKLHNKTVVKRSCFYENKMDSSKHCNNTTKEAAPHNVEVLFCETCLSDGCNGATELAPMATISLAPVFIAKLLTW